MVLDPSWMIVLLLLPITLYFFYFRPRWPEKGVVLLLTASVLVTAGVVLGVYLHELSHVWVAHRRGMPLHPRTLFSFGGASRFGTESPQPKDLLLEAGVGPLASALLGAVLLALGGVLGARGSLASGCLTLLGGVHLLLGVAHLLPAYPLDGGRMARASLWLLSGSEPKATRLAVRLTSFVAAGLVLSGAGLIVTGQSVLAGGWTIVGGGLLLHGARTSFRRLTLRAALARRRVSQALKARCPRVPGLDTVEAFVAKHVEGAGETCALVESGAVSGWLTLEEVKRVPRRLWDETTLETVMVPLSEVPQVRKSDTLLVALDLMNRRGLDQLPVVENSDFLGLVGREEVLRVGSIDLELAETERI
jgi:Zn-dependent protease